MLLGAALLAGCGIAQAQNAAPADDPSKTLYGTIAPSAPAELRTFAFLIGKWDGKGNAPQADGTSTEVPVRWIGRYVLDGTAIADELASTLPDGKAYLGISLRQYDATRKTWIVEFLNVTGSFLRRQVNATSGAVIVDGQNVTIASEAPGIRIREHYLVPDHNHFTYRMDLSNDGGTTWTEGQVEMTFVRVE
ncbi:MAG: DUF1579 family protein [Gammaproteobacteria bacterium]|nr:DUF1579 family protein [Gammaproteobacteria bacterium]